MLKVSISYYINLKLRANSGLVFAIKETVYCAHSKNYTIKFSASEDHNIITDSHEYLHRKNVRIRGLPEIEGRALIDMFRELASKKLGLVMDDMDIDLAQWAGPSLQDGTRPAVVTFAQYAMKQKILDAARLKLRDSPYVLFEDLFVGNGENLTELAHQRGVDACYKHISKVFFYLRNFFVFHYSKLE